MCEDNLGMREVNVSVKSWGCSAELSSTLHSAVCHNGGTKLCSSLTEVLSTGTERSISTELDENAELF